MIKLSQDMQVHSTWYSAKVRKYVSLQRQEMCYCVHFKAFGHEFKFYGKWSTKWNINCSVYFEIIFITMNFITALPWEVVFLQGPRNMGKHRRLSTQARAIYPRPQLTVSTMKYFWSLRQPKQSFVHRCYMNMKLPQGEKQASNSTQVCDEIFYVLYHHHHQDTPTKVVSPTKVISP
jgi:hypothetical protein